MFFYVIVFTLIYYNGHYTQQYYSYIICYKVRIVLKCQTGLFIA